MKKLLLFSICFLTILSGCSSNKATSELVPTKIIEVPQTRQAKSYTCGVAVMQSILYYYGIEYRQDVLETELKSNENDGTSFKKMMSYLNKNNINTVFKQKMTIDNLKENIDNGKLTLMFIQAWNGENNYDYSNSWEDGHYVIAIGYDKERIYFMDPSTISNYTYIANEELMKRWHDYDKEAKYYQTGITISGPEIKYNKNEYKSLD